jgi:predicted enzyme related to lactoylglutathione lyase
MYGPGLDFVSKHPTPTLSLRRRVLIASLSSGLIGCAVSEPPVIPSLPVDAAASYGGPQFVWYDLFSNDVEGASAFYGELFGWEFESHSEYGNFSLARHNGTPVAGLVRIDEARAESVPPQWVPNLLVGDVDEVTGHFTESGTVLKGPDDMPDRGRIAVVEDPEGAPLLLLQTRNGVPGSPDGTHGRFLWTELWSTDLSVSLPFYEAAVGFTRVAGPDGLDPNYRILGTGDRRLAGLIEIPYDSVRPHWLSYISVADPVEVVRKAESLGGRVIIAPDETSGRIAAVIADPTGGVFGIQKWPLEGHGKEQP